ncbi:Eco57I restriction-modification methylase domain-containing protein [Streptomyces sp. NPDC005148]
MELINAGRFQELFREELGWSRPDHPPMNIEADGHQYVLTQLAGFKGVRVWGCPTVPPGRVQRRIDQEVKKVSDERLVIFADRAIQEWRWPQSSNIHGSGQPRLVIHNHVVGATNPALDQRLAMVEIGMDEDPSVVEILRRMRAAFDADKVTKSFYDKFLAKHKELVKAIRGLEAPREREWYGALLMNRLMFIYFMQRKGFMDGDRDYLRNRLHRLQNFAGEDRFYEFYRDFLLPLCHEGLGAPGLDVVDKQIKAMVGDVPYINGGIFSVHELEAKHPDIRIPDEVFVAIFDLFDAYQWHLDDRPTAVQNEINPDVLGYIFEQFINQKEQGAYYTKGDVTHFMTASTLIPVFLERLEAATEINVWANVVSYPERYIWESLQYGTHESLPDDVMRAQEDFPRSVWNEKAPESHALPGETWWEVAQRRKTLESIVEVIKSGGINNVDAAVTANIDLESLATDAIDDMDTHAEIMATWRVLTELKVIDPTCGSGAFLFAALKILQGLYSAVLDAARVHASNCSDPDLLSLLQEVDSHANPDYFILKHATLNNLYGVDLMKEATEIARLRLFLKLVAAIDDRADLEPLPDLDFNIKAGNILVGARDVDEIRHHNDLMSSLTIEQVLDDAGKIRTSYRAYRKAQEVGNESTAKQAKTALATQLANVRNTVNEHFHAVNGVSKTIDEWAMSHSPFHWFIEYPEVFDNGGFDVVIGNPPYVSKRKIKDYTFKGFDTNDAPDIYASCTERSTQITRQDGRMALIVPISAQFGNEFAPLRTLLEERFSNLWVSTFSRNPAALFSAGLGVRSTIIVGSGHGGGGSSLRVTKTHRWVDAYRPALFETLRYVDAKSVRGKAGWIRLVDDQVTKLFSRILSRGSLGQMVRRVGTGSIGFKTTALYWLSVFDEDPPSYELDFRPTPQTKTGRLRFDSEREARVALAVAASKLAFVWWYSTGDDFDVTAEGFKSTPIDPSALSAGAKEHLIRLADRLFEDFPNHVAFTKYAGKWMGNYVLSEMRDITDSIDRILAQELGYEDLLPALEHAYYCAYKPTGDRPGTLRHDPSLKRHE